METLHGALNLYLLRGPEVNAGKFPSANFSWTRGDDKSHMEPDRDCRGMG